MGSGSGWRSLRAGKGLDEVGKREPLKQCEGKADCKGNRECGGCERQSVRKLLTQEAEVVQPQCPLLNPGMGQGRQ